MANRLWGENPRAAARLGALRTLAPLLTRLAPADAQPPTSSSQHRSQRPGPNPRLLLIRPDHLGDALLAAPTGLALRAVLPHARIDWLVGPWAAEVIRRAPHADRIMTCRFPGFTRHPKRLPWEPYLELARQARRLRGERYDLALVLRPDHWWGAMLAAATGIPRRLGYDVPECAPFLTHAVATDSRVHGLEQGLALARLAAETLHVPSPIPRPEPTFGIEPSERSWARAILGPPTDRPTVAIHPGSGAPVKNWLPGRWREVAAALGAQAGARLVLTGGETEAGLLAEVAAEIEDPVPLLLAGRTTLGQLAAVFERCALVLGGDSGPLHLAQAVGTPTLRLYGPTDPARFGPRGNPAHHRVVSSRLHCQPCGNIAAPPCGETSTPACLRVLWPAQVAHEALRLLKAPRAARQGSPSGP